MLLEMQSAMNNMMNSSQALAAAPSGSPPSSPQSSSDREPAVAMDTGSSSASDSGEEEAIGSVTRAHQETFMYNQEQSSLTPEAPRATRALNNSCGQKQTGGQQEAWNQRHNLATLAARGPSSSLGPRVPEDNNSNLCPFTVCGSAVSHCPTYIHGAFRGSATQGATSRAFTGPLWRGGNRMHLVRLGAIFNGISDI